MIFSKCLEKSKKITYIGMRIIIFMMLFVVGNNLLVINASAISFPNFTVGGAAGSINTANGFYDNDASAYGYSGNRNVYIVTEPTQAWIFEPICYNAGSSVCSGSGSTNFQVINSTAGTLKDAVVHNGYVYFIEGTTLLKKKTRNVNTVCESNNTGLNGCIATIATGMGGEVLRTYNNRLYFWSSSTAISYLDQDDNPVTVYTGLRAAVGVRRGLGVSIVNNVVTVYFDGKCGAGNSACIIKYNGTETILKSGAGTPTQAFTTLVPMSNYMYEFYVDDTTSTNESLISLSNNTMYDIDYITTAYNHASRLYIGSQSTIGLWATSSTYQTFNAIEAGAGDSIGSSISELTYTTKIITSLDNTYYNKSTIYLQYNIILTTDLVTKLSDPYANYRWIVSTTDPNGVTQDIVQTPECQYDGLTDITCQIDSTMGLRAPSNGWLIGTWNAKLYELNTVSLHRALISTSPNFVVLNTSVENQSIISPPDISHVSGTSPQAISKIDSFTSWWGLGVNSVSKLLTAMVIIAIAATVGLIWGNGSIALVFAFVPYAFFTFIEYIPKWIFIITIILLAIYSRAFR